MAKKLMKAQTGKIVKPSNSSFKQDSIQFRKDEKAYGKNDSFENQKKVVNAIKKYGTTKLTGKRTYTISDMQMSDASKTIKKKGGAVKAKKK